MNPTEAIPVLATSKPTPAPPPLVVGVSSSRFNFASLAFSSPLHFSCGFFFRARCQPSGSHAGCAGR